MHLATPFIWQGERLAADYPEPSNNATILNSAESLLVQYVADHGKNKSIESVARMFVDDVSGAGDDSDAAYCVVVDALRTLESEGLLTCDPEVTQCEIWGRRGLFIPLGLTVELTDFCNFKCGHCYIDGGPSNRRYISMDAIEALDPLSGMMKSVDLTGGEATTHPQFAEIVTHVSGKFQVHLLSNGSRLSRIPGNVIEKLSYASISLYGRDEESLWRASRTRGFRNVEEGLDALKNSGVVFDVTIQANQDTLLHAERYIEIAVEHGARALRLGVSAPSGRNLLRDPFWNLTTDQLCQLRDRIESTRSRFGSYIKYPEYEERIFSGWRPDISKRVPVTARCQAGRQIVAISADGYVRPCILFPPEMYRNGTTVGDWVRNRLSGGGDDKPELNSVEEFMRSRGSSLLEMCPVGMTVA